MLAWKQAQDLCGVEWQLCGTGPESVLGRHEPQDGTKDAPLNDN
jgi:hypothetical protein